MISDQDKVDALYRQNLEAFTLRALSEIEPSTNFINNWHIGCVCYHLQAVWDGEIRRIIINIPPRFLKTLIASVCFPAWGFGQNPSIKFMNTSFKFDRAKSMTRKTRQIMESDWYEKLNPHVRLSREQNEKHHFETTRKGQYYASAMPSVTGEGADIQCCDDPLNPMEAVSDTMRMNAIDTIRETLFSRFNDPQTGRFILIMQRLHDQDPTGDLLKDEGWTHLKLPVETTKTHHVIKFKDREWEYDKSGLLFPERFNKDVIAEKRMELGAYGFAGQYLQEPVPLGGGEFKEDYLKYFHSQSFDAKGCNIYILCDPATSKKKTSDYTAMAVWALAPDQNYYLIDGIRERLNPTERINKLFELHRKWNLKTGKPPQVGWERYGMMSDIHYIEKKQEEDSYRFHITEIQSKMQKEERIRRLVPAMENRRIYLPNDIFYKNHKGLPQNFMSDIVEQEMLVFPFAAHDDFLDAMSMIFDMNPIFPKLASQEVTDGLFNEHEELSVLDL